MKFRGLATVTVILLAIAFGLAIIVSSFIEDDACTPIDGGSSVAGGVPDGHYSKPMKEGTHQISSGYRSADRPDHRGTDMAADLHTPIYAFADGVDEVRHGPPARDLREAAVTYRRTDDAVTGTVPTSPTAS